jgi:hypothetical protein
LQFIILLITGWINREQRMVIDYLVDEIRVYQEHFKDPRLRFIDEQRRRLGKKAKAMGGKHRKKLAGIVTPDTLLCWYRTHVARKIDGSAKRRPGRLRTRDNIRHHSLLRPVRDTYRDPRDSHRGYYAQPYEKWMKQMVRNLTDSSTASCVMQ